MRTTFHKNGLKLELNKTPYGIEVILEESNECGFDCIFNHAFKRFNPIAILDEMIEQGVKKGLEFEKVLYNLCDKMIINDGEDEYEVLIADIEPLKEDALLLTLILYDDPDNNTYIVFSAISYPNGFITPWDWQTGEVNRNELDAIEWRDEYGNKCGFINGLPRSVTL